MNKPSIYTSKYIHGYARKRCGQLALAFWNFVMTVFRYSAQERNCFALHGCALSSRWLVLMMISGVRDSADLKLTIWKWEWKSSWKTPEPRTKLWSLSTSVEWMLWGSDRYSNPVQMVVDGWLCQEFSSLCCFLLVWLNISEKLWTGLLHQFFADIDTIHRPLQNFKLSMKNVLFRSHRRNYCWCYVHEHVIPMENS